MFQVRRLLAQSMGLVFFGTMAACVPGITKTAAVTPVPPTAALTPIAASATPPAAPSATALSTDSYPGPEASATLDATQAYIVSLKATGIAMTHLTETAQPTGTPPPSTPTFPAGAAPCRASELALGDSSQGATGTIVIQAKITNVGQTVCYLQGPPDIQLVDQAGQPLDVVYSTACFLCNNVDALGTALPAATQTAAADDRLKVKFGLGPGEGVWTVLLWNNWCKPFPEGEVRVQLLLPNASGVATGPLDIPGAGRCDVPGAPSTLVIGEYSRAG